MRRIMTLERREQQIGSIFSVEILHLALDDSEVVVFRVNLKPQLFTLALLIVVLKLKNAYRLDDQEILVEILCRFK
jgi:hypothetical protein